MSGNGMTTLRSQFGPEETMNRLEIAVRRHGLRVFAHIDHAAGAAEAGLPLRPTDLLIFGNASAGTRLMQQAQTAGIDLPLKALVWSDAAGDTWLSYGDPEWIAARHGLDCDAAVEIGAMAGMLAALARIATGER